MSWFCFQSIRFEDILKTLWRIFSRRTFKQILVFTVYIEDILKISSRYISKTSFAALSVLSDMSGRHLENIWQNRLFLWMFLLIQMFWRCLDNMFAKMNVWWDHFAINKSCSRQSNTLKSSLSPSTVRIFL